MQNYKSLCPSVTICHTLVNRQTYKQTHTYAIRAASVWYKNKKVKSHILDIALLSEEPYCRSA